MFDFLYFPSCCHLLFGALSTMRHPPAPSHSTNKHHTAQCAHTHCILQALSSPAHVCTRSVYTQPFSCVRAPAQPISCMHVTTHTYTTYTHISFILGAFSTRKHTHMLEHTACSACTHTHARAYSGLGDVCTCTPSPYSAPWHTNTPIQCSHTHHLHPTCICRQGAHTCPCPGIRGTSMSQCFCQPGMLPCPH